MQKDLKGYQRSALMKQAHALKPVAMVGKHGLTPQVSAHVDRELAQHELVKVRFADYKSVKREISEQLSIDLDATLVSVIGNIGVLYRPALQEEDRNVTVPDRSKD
jgi:RNA-binding protein